MDDSFEKIYCYIGLDLSSANRLFDLYKTHKEVSKDIKTFFDKYGVKYEIIEPGGAGGGADFVGFIETIKELYGNYEGLKIILPLLKFIFFLLGNKVKTHISNKASRKPAMTLSLSLQGNNLNNFISNRYMQSFFRDRMIGLKVISEELVRIIKINHPLFDIHQELLIMTTEDNMRYSINIADKQISKYNNFRILRIIDGHKVKKNKNTNYTIKSKFLMKRSDTHEKNEKTIDKNYFLIVSKNILTDFL